MRSADKHNAAGQGQQTCTSGDCDRSATWEAFIDEAEPPAWHPYCADCIEPLWNAYSRIRKLPSAKGGTAGSYVPLDAFRLSDGRVMVRPGTEGHRIPEHFVALDAVVEFLWANNSKVAAAKVSAEFGSSVGPQGERP